MKELQITKTDYLNFRFCRKNLWLEKNKPEEFEQLPLSDFELEIVKEGKEVDKEAQNLFPEGVCVSGDQDVAVSETNFHLKELDNNENSGLVLFQAAIKVGKYYIRTDILKWNIEKNFWELYEVKATTKIKREKFNNHIYDLAFQYNICLMAGLDIQEVGVIHLSADYKKHGELDYSKLFKTEIVTGEIKEIAEDVKEEMLLMSDYLKGPEENFCQCRFRTRSDKNHCTTFNYSNPDIPDYAVHDVSRISSKKLSQLMDDEIFSISDIPGDFKLSDNQVLQVTSAKLNKPIIDIEKIAEFLDEFQYPLYFLDYESYLPAIPWFDHYGPYQNIVFQYSLHILEERMPSDADADWLSKHIKHEEFLAKDPVDPSLDLVKSLQKNIPANDGSVIVWHKPFEMGRNRELGNLQAHASSYMAQLNDRIIDLKEIFSKGMYVDPKFKGSASIKKVLPIMAPELSYENLPINNGADANKMWGKIIKKEIPESEIAKAQKNLLIYCEQDTFAMVRIWQELKNLFEN